MILKRLKDPKYLIGIFIIAFLAIVYSSCDITDPSKNIAVIFNTLSISTNISVSFVDAATGVQIGSSTQSQLININFTGTGASKIVSSLDEPLTSTSTKYGVVTFGVADNFTPSASNPIQVTVEASSSGYQTTSYPLNIQSTGSSTYTIKMIKISAPPAGTSTAPSTPVPTNSSGQTTSTTTTTTGTETSSGGSAGLTINSGTSITDASGKPVTGSLTANVTYISGNNSTNGALPTGLSVGVINQDQSNGQGFIQPAAFASFTVTNQSGQLAKNFSTPVTLSFTVSGSTINSLTNAPIQNGDTVPIYSFDETSQKWKFETNSTAVSNASGDFILTFQASHLSDWFAGWVISGADVCTTNLTLNVTGNYSALLLTLSVQGTTVASQTINSNQNKFVYNNITVPKGVPVKIDAYSLLECPNPIVGTVTINDLCSANTITLNVDPGPNHINVAVDVTAFCNNKNPVLEVKPSGYEIFVSTPCGGNVDLGTINNGQINLNGLPKGTTYTFGMIYKGALYTQNHTVDQTSYTYNYNIADSVCNADFK